MTPITPEHYNNCMAAFRDLAAMFSALDEYRRTGDKRFLFIVKSRETTVRAQMKQVLNENYETAIKNGWIEPETPSNQNQSAA